jgi:S1-C subfamily serine protease
MISRLGLVILLSGMLVWAVEPPGSIGDEALQLLGVEGTPDKFEGFRLTAVRPYSVAAKAGLHATDDAIIAVNGKPVKTENDVNLALRGRSSSDVLITFMHQYWRQEKLVRLP